MDFARPYELSKKSNSVCGILCLIEDGLMCRKAYEVDRTRSLSSIDAARTIASSAICSGNPHDAVLILFRTTAFSVILGEAMHLCAVIDAQTKTMIAFKRFMLTK